MGAGHQHHGTVGAHEHGPPGHESNQRRLLSTLSLAAGFMVVEFIGGLLTGSLALLADAGHMLSDVAALGLGYFAFWMTRRPASPQRTFGYYRTEILVALWNGAMLIGIAVLILIEAYERLGSPGEIHGAGMMMVAAGGLGVNLLGLWILHGGQSSNLNMRGAYLHVLADALGSIGALLAGAAVWLMGWNRADAIVSVAISLLVIWSSWNLVRQSVAVLMEGTPGGINVDDVRDAIMEIPGVIEVHDLHVWSITSGIDSLSAHAVVSELPDRCNWPHILSQIRGVVHDRFGIDHVTVQLEPRGFSEHRGRF